MSRNYTFFILFLSLGLRLSAQNWGMNVSVNTFSQILVSNYHVRAGALWKNWELGGHVGTDPGLFIKGGYARYYFPVVANRSAPYVDVYGGHSINLGSLSHIPTSNLNLAVSMGLKVHVWKNLHFHTQWGWGKIRIRDWNNEYMTRFAPLSKMIWTAGSLGLGYTFFRQEPGSADRQPVQPAKTLAINAQLQVPTVYLGWGNSSWLLSVNGEVPLAPRWHLLLGPEMSFPTPGAYLPDSLHDGFRLAGARAGTRFFPVNRGGVRYYLETSLACLDTGPNGTAFGFLNTGHMMRFRLGRGIYLDTGCGYAQTVQFRPKGNTGVNSSFYMNAGLHLNFPEMRPGIR